MPLCQARSTLTVTPEDTLPATSVCVKVSVCGGLIPVLTHEMSTEKVLSLQVVVVGLLVRLALAIETVDPVSQLPVAVLVVVIIFALADGAVIVGADGAVVSIVNDVTARILLTLLDASVTVIVQLE